MEARTVRTTYLTRVRLLRRFLDWSGAPIPPAMNTGLASAPLPKPWAGPLADWSIHLHAAGAPATTRELRIRTLRRFAHGVGVARPEDVTTADLVRWLGSHANWSTEYRYSVRGSLRAFYHWAADTGVPTSTRRPNCRRCGARPRSRGHCPRTPCMPPSPGHVAPTTTGS